MVFLIPFMLVGIGLILLIPMRLFLQSYGTPVTVTVDGGHINRSSKGNSKTYHIQFHYVFNGQMRQDQQQVTLAEYNQMPNGKQASARVMQIGKWCFCISTVGNPNTTTGLFVFLALFWNAFMSVFFAFTWGAAIRQRRLVRDGIATSGTIVDHNMIRGKTTMYSIKINFKTSDGTEITNKVSVSQKAYTAAEVGNAVTVLYDPVKPKRSVAYEYCNFEIVPMVG